MTPSTFNERVRGEEGAKQSPSVSSRSKKRGGKSWWVGEGEREKEGEEGRGREGQREGGLRHAHVHVYTVLSGLIILTFCLVYLDLNSAS